MRLEPKVEPVLHAITGRAGQPFIRNNTDPRVQRVVRGHELGNGIAGPAQRPVGRQDELLVRRIGQFFSACIDLAGQRLERGRLQGLGIGSSFGRLRRKHEPVEAANYMALYDHFARLTNLSVQHRVFPQAAHQYTGPAVNETLS